MSIAKAEPALTALLLTSCVGIVTGASLFYVEWRADSARARHLEAVRHMQHVGDVLLDEMGAADGWSDLESLNARFVSWERETYEYFQEHLPNHAISFRTMPLFHMSLIVHAELKNAATMLLFRLDALRQILLTTG